MLYSSLMRLCCKRRMLSMEKNLKSGCSQVAGFKMAIYLVMLVTLVCSAGKASAVQIRVGGGLDECNGFFDFFKDLIKDEKGINLIVTPSSASRSLIDLDRGKIDIATTDVTLESLLTELENKGYPVVPESFQVQGIGTNTILVYINKANKVSSLSQQQLSDIFTGRITNWKHVGGEDQEIVVVWGDETSEQNRLFQQYVIGAEPIVRSAAWATDERDIIERIVKTPGGIGIASHIYQSARTHNPITPFVSAKVIAITKGAPSIAAQQVLEMIKTFDY